MNIKIVYLFDKATGQFIGTYEAYESPAEPGVFIAPDCSTEKEPPVTAANERSVFDVGAGVWNIVPAIVTTKDGIDTTVLNPSYAELRAAAYPPIADQLDMQFKDALNGTTTWFDAIAAVKAQYPKI